jgi:hypothetical protein
MTSHAAERVPDSRQSIAMTFGLSAVGAYYTRKPLREHTATTLLLTTIEPAGSQTDSNRRALPGNIAQRSIVAAVNVAGFHSTTRACGGELRCRRDHHRHVWLMKDFIACEM